MASSARGDGECRSAHTNGDVLLPLRFWEIGVGLSGGRSDRPNHLRLPPRGRSADVNGSRRGDQLQLCAAWAYPSRRRLARRRRGGRPGGGGAVAALRSGGVGDLSAHAAAQESLGPSPIRGMGGDRRRGDQVGLVGGQRNPARRLATVVRPSARTVDGRPDLEVGDSQFSNRRAVTDLGDRPGGGGNWSSANEDRLQHPVAGYPGTFDRERTCVNRPTSAGQRVQLVAPPPRRRRPESNPSAEPGNDQHLSVVVEQVIGPSTVGATSGGD